MTSTLHTPSLHTAPLHPAPADHTTPPADHAAPQPAASSTPARPPLPLQERPRRVRVQREPSPRAAARAVRRTAPRTTARTWRRSGLPGPAAATAGARPADVAMAVLVVALLFVPVLVWTQWATGAWIALAVSLVVVAGLSWARRIVVGADFVAVRQLGRYHVAHADHVRHLELRAMQNGVLCLHTDDGRCMRLRRVELEREDVAAALRTLAGCGSSTRDRRVCALLGLEDEHDRVVDRDLPRAA